jgi:protein O-mannosyl-transferase
MKQKYIKFILIFILGFIVFRTVLNVPFLWDDHAAVESNRYIIKWNWNNIIHNFTSDYFNTGSEYYRPVFTLLNMVNFSIWKLDPFGYHLMSLLLHILNAIMVYLVLNLFFKDDRVSFLAAILFLIHPVQVNVLSNNVGDSLLCFLFILILIYLFFSYDSFISQLGANFSFLLALFSKEIAVISPFLLVLLVFIFHPEKKKEYIKKSVPFFILLAIYLFMRPHLINTSYPGIDIYQALLFLIVYFPRLVFEYFAILLLPFNMYMIRPVPAFSELNIVYSLVFFSVFLYIIRSHYKILKFNFIWFTGFLLLTLFLLNGSAFIFEHWVYFSSVAFSLSIAILFNQLISSRYDLLKITGVTLLPLAVIFYGILGFYNMSFRQDEVVFFSHTVQYTPLSKVYNNLGRAYFVRGEYEKALYFAKKAAIAEPITMHLNGLGAIYAAMGEYESAIYTLKQVIIRKADDATTHLNLGTAYFKKGMLKEAIQEENIALKINPLSEDAYFKLGKIYKAADEKEKAGFYYKKALSINPYFVDAHIGLADFYAEKRNWGKAQEECYIILKIEPNNKKAIHNVKIAEENMKDK